MLTQWVMSRKHGKGHRYYFLHNILHKTQHKLAKHRQDMLHKIGEIEWWNFHWESCSLKILCVSVERSRKPCWQLCQPQIKFSYHHKVLTLGHKVPNAYHKLSFHNILKYFLFLSDFASHKSSFHIITKYLLWATMYLMRTTN